MPNIPGAKKLVKQVKELKLQADIMNDKIIEKHRWLDQKDDKYIESEKGQEWLDYLDRLEDFIEEIYSIYTEDIEVVCG